MREYKYSLASVLDVRELEQEQQRERHAAAVRRRTAQEQELAQLQEQIAGARRRVLQAHSASALQQMDRYLCRLRRQERSCLERLRALDREVEQMQIALVEASREVKKMEKLRENEYKQWCYAFRREEQRRLDESATVRHGHGRLQAPVPPGAGRRVHTAGSPRP